MINQLCICRESTLEFLVICSCLVFYGMKGSDIIQVISHRPISHGGQDLMGNVTGLTAAVGARVGNRHWPWALCVSPCPPGPRPVTKCIFSAPPVTYHVLWSGLAMAVPQISSSHRTEGTGVLGSCGSQVPAPTVDGHPPARHTQSPFWYFREEWSKGCIDEKCRCW